MSQLIEALQEEYKNSFFEIKYKGNFFQKKFHKLNPNLLARALHIYRYKFTTSYGYTDIIINKHLSLKVLFDCTPTWLNYYKMSYYTLKSNEGYSYGFKINFDIIIDSIKIATYKINNYSCSSYYDLFTNKKFVYEKEIIHEIPYQFIKMLEEWASHIIEEFETYFSKLEEEVKNAKLSEESKAKQLQIQQLQQEKEQFRKEKNILSQYY